ncbi:MAG TPA: serine hydrolase domain-containing protein [Candidatus Elarobacter sp.]|jgi:CubicO group peptidase (beta-lactamase class C family)|nr:serine hydrolase domain-containing protein [Candidatus Elarobacter sp.]
MNLDAALEYAERHALHALVVRAGDDVVLERYAGGYDAEKPHALYSGTKSFWGVLAVAAEEEGMLELDEPVARTIPSWSEGAKARVTLRELLQLTSGIGFGGLGSAVPTYDAALATELKNEPGSTFTYGGIPLQVFGAVLARKLAPRGRTPHEYLRERILDPIGLRIGNWRTLKDGTHPLPTGAFVTAREWLKYGVLVRDRGPALARCFTGSRANPRYGLAWWLSPLPAHPDVAYASGSGGQALYVIPSANAVVVKFGNASSYKHDAFLKRLLSA